MRVNNLQVEVFGTRAEMGEMAALRVQRKIGQLLKHQKYVNMIFAAAPSQNEFLALLKGLPVEWSRVRAFHMDEYIGLDKEAPQGFGNFLRDRLFGALPFMEVYYIGNSAEECERYEELLRRYPPDIVCMGIGENGHIAFNDPPVADFKDPKWVKVVELDQPCRQQQVNDGCFSSLDKVPTHAITLTVPALMAGKYVYCMVPGPLKAEAVYNTLHGEIAEAVPASILRRHEHAELFLDKASADRINWQKIAG